MSAGGGAPLRGSGHTGMWEGLTYGFRGIRTLFQTQKKARMQALSSMGLCALGAAVGLTREEWCWLLVSVTVVWALEAMNTAVEFLTDLVCPGYHPLAGQAKDVATGATTIGLLGALLVAALVFAPHVARLLAHP